MTTSTFCLSEQPQCPSCGAEIKIECTGIVHCPYCGTNIFVDPSHSILSRIVYPQIKSARFPELVSTFLGQKYRRRINHRRRFYPYWSFTCGGKQHILPAVELDNPLPVGDLTANVLQEKNEEAVNLENELLPPTLSLPIVMERASLGGEATKVVLLQLPYYHLTITPKQEALELVMDGLTGEIWPLGAFVPPPMENWRLSFRTYLATMAGGALAAFFLPYWAALPLTILIVIGTTKAYQNVRGY